ncbi:MAG TPA: TetR/AcrR family transcriptional regulator [Anaeromyxobacter sp.]
MPRGRAEDYGAKRQEILDAAAAVFARTGYANSNMLDVARVCGASKSMLYHYFPRKEGVLFELMLEHVSAVRRSIEDLVAGTASAEERLRGFVRMWIAKSASARSRHAVLMYDLKFLPPRQKRAIAEARRDLVEQVAGIVGELNPRVQSGDWARTYALLLFGMLNWTDVWYRSTGPYSPVDLAEQVLRVFLRGLGVDGAATAVVRSGEEGRPRLQPTRAAAGGGRDSRSRGTARR